MNRSVPVPADDAELRRRYGDLMRAAASDETHPAEDVWVRFGCDELNDDERARLADHVVACAACADVFRAVSTVRAGARDFDAQAPAPETSRGRGWYGLAAAAAVVLAAGSVAWWQTASRTGREPGPVVVTTAPAGPATAPVTPSAAAPAPRPWAALTTAPAVSLPASLALVVRGAASDREAFMTAFGAAMTPYREARYADAATALESVTRRFPQIPEGWFYLGVSRLFAGRADDAVEPLRRARVSEVVGNEARWLEAVALERAGRAADATAALRVICDGAGPLQMRACEAARTDR